MLTSTLNGKTITYNLETEFLIQVGKGNGIFTTFHKTVGSLSTARTIFQMIKVGIGGKKRLYVPSTNTVILKETNK